MDVSGGTNCNVKEVRERKVYWINLAWYIAIYICTNKVSEDEFALDKVNQAQDMQTLMIHFPPPPIRAMLGPGERPASCIWEIGDLPKRVNADGGREKSTESTATEGREPLIPSGND